MFSAIAFYNFNEDSSYSDSDDEETMCIQRRKIRDKTNVLDIPNDEFKENFRMNKEVFQYLFGEVAPRLKRTYRSTHLPPQMKLATFLRFLATGSFQKSVGNEYFSSMSKSAVSTVITECLEIYEQYFCHKWIRLNRTVEEENAVKEYFFNSFGVPGIVGCVDGIHVRIRSPGEDMQHLYYNRKGFYSLNAMVVCDHNMVITFVDARHPGCNHDAFVWHHSTAEQHFRSVFNNGRRNTWILGDSGYPLLPYLMTPIRNPSDSIETLYNEKHCKARNVVKRCFGVLKNRFRSIIGSRGLHYSAAKATKIFNVCCAIHNVCIFYKNDLPPLHTISSAQDSTENFDYSTTDGSVNEAVIIRRQLAISLH